MAMKCPSCNFPVRKLTDEAGEKIAYCPQCGWGGQHPAADPVRTSRGPGAAPAWYWLALGWPVTLTLVIGPYLALCYTYWPLDAWIHGTYWAAMVIYIGLAAVETVNVDTSDLGWCGGLIDNPFSFFDDYNRMKLIAAILMVPGKIIAWTLLHTYRVLRPN